MRAARWVVTVGSMLGLLLTACGGGGDDAPPSNAGAGGSGAGGAGSGGAAGAAGGTSGIACVEDGALDVGGLFAVKVRLEVTMKSDPAAVVSVCPADQRGAADLVGIVRVSQSGTTVDALDTIVCDVTLPPVTAIAGSCSAGQKGTVATQVSLSKALIAQVPKVRPKTVKATLGGTAPGATFEPERLVFILGSKAASADGMAKWKDTSSSSPCNSLTKPLGTSMDCEVMCVSDCGDVVDADQDGYPGASFDVCGRGDEPPGALCNTDDPSEPGVTLQGKAFVDFVIDPQLSGVAKSSCEIAGGADASIRYNVLGANVRLSGSLLPVGSVITSIPAFEVVKETSKYRAVRVDGKHAAPDWKLDFSDPASACDALRKNASSVF
ncbi:MAG: hypothetical protein IT374_24230 [Polyangiaceae bacterium]|nr:hypothetical protein [Polyangiaceae bacterium]